MASHKIAIFAVETNTQNMVLLEFEEPIQELVNQLEKTKEIGSTSNVDVSLTVSELEKKINEKKVEIYRNLSPWQRVQLSRHPERPYTLAYINAITTDFIELHGDRLFKDDKAIVGGFAKIDDQTVMVLGHQKGINTKMRQYRNFGMANPDGYRKALRLMKLAEKFNNIHEYNTSQSNLYRYSRRLSWN